MGPRGGRFAECGPSRAEQGRLGLSGGWGGVGHALGFNWLAAWGRFGPSGA